MRRYAGNFGKKVVPFTDLHHRKVVKVKRGRGTGADERAEKLLLVLMADRQEWNLVREGMGTHARER